MKIFNYLLDTIDGKGAAYLILIDPDKFSNSKIEEFVPLCESSGTDGFLVGGSLMFNNNFESVIKKVKNASKLPAVIFPGEVNQISGHADAILYLSIISGRNPDHLIGKHVLAAPIIKSIGIEPISTGYMLIESGVTTTAQYMNGGLPIPRNKPEIAVATALAAEYMGMKLIYLEAGSGAKSSVPNEMIKAVASNCSLPLIVGGGIKNSKTAREKVECGAKIIVTGNFFEDKRNWHLIKDFANAVHIKSSVVV